MSDGYTKPLRIALLGFAICLCLAAVAACAAPVESGSPNASDTATEQLEADGPAGASGDTGDSSATDGANGKDGSQLAKKLKADIKPIVRKSGMDMGVCVIDLASGAHASVGGKKRMVAASMIKLLVAASFLEHAEAGDFALDDKYALKEDDIVGGTGSLGGRGAGAEVEYGTMLEKMISESDNTATNALIGAIGMEAVNETAERLGLTETELKRLMMDEDAIAEGVENYTSANDVAKLLQLAHAGELVSPKASKTLMKALRKQNDDTGILAGLPKGTSFAHKTGALGGAQNDGGIVEAEDDFVVVVMCGGSGFNLDGALDAMADIGRTSYRDIIGTGKA